MIPYEDLDELDKWVWGVPDLWRDESEDNQKGDV